SAFTTLSLFSAFVYAAGVACGQHLVAAASECALTAEQQRHRMLARSMGDAVTRHDTHGDVTQASRGIESFLGIPARDLLGKCLFERVHVGDRPGYLTALADAAVSARPTMADFRVRRDGLTYNEYVWVEMRCQPSDPLPFGEREVMSV